MKRAGKLYLEIGRFDQEFLFQDSLPAGVGSNDIGLDRGQLGETRIVKFQRSGPKVLLVQQNLNFRASSSNALERESVEEALRSPCWRALKWKPRKATVCWWTPPLSSCRMRIAFRKRCSRKNKAPSIWTPIRSALYLPRTRSFPKNTEVESTLTFAGEQPGAWVQIDVVPSPESITVREHYSFVELPRPGV